MQRTAVGLIALLAWAVAARGDSFLDRPWGTPAAGLDSARSRAMGGTGVVGCP